MIECFESNINQALMMDIAVPLVQHLIPETIPNFSEQNTYIKLYFSEMFEKEYGFHPNFIVIQDRDKIYVEIRVIQIYSLNDLEDLKANLMKLRDKLKGFTVRMIGIEVDL